jgi:membrane fusion protein (multidrug efflux system)
MSSETEKKPATADRLRGALLFRVVFGLAGLCLLFWLAHLGLRAWHYTETDDAYLTGRLHQVAPQIGGQVTEVLVQDNQEVAAGQPLVKLDPLGPQIAVERARAAAAQADAQVSQSEAALHLIDSQIEEARFHETQARASQRISESDLALAGTTHQRNLQLMSHGGGATQADLDRSQADLVSKQAALEVSAASLASASSAVRTAEANRISAVEQQHAAVAALRASQAALHDAERQLSYTVISAPTAGRVGNRHVEVGNLVVSGQTLLSLAEPEVWVVANFKETQLARMQPGQEVELSIDAIPGEKLHGKVESFSPASGAQFALLPPDNATGNFNKVVQRVPVKILLEQEELRRLGGRIRLGLSVIVEVKVR